MVPCALIVFFSVIRGELAKNNKRDSTKMPHLDISPQKLWNEGVKYGVIER